MADIPLPGQSTDKTFTDTNPLTPRVIKQGSVTIPASSFGAVTGGFAAVTSVTIYTGEKDGALRPTHEVYHYVDQGSSIQDFRKCSYVIGSGTTISNYAYTVLERQLVSGTVESIILQITYFTNSSSAGVKDSSANPQTFYYTIYSTSLIG